MRTVPTVAGAVDTRTVAGRVKAARIKSGMKVPAVAERAGHKRQWLYDIEAGKYTPNPDDLRAVAQALKIDAGYLLSGTETGDSDFIAKLRGLESSLDDRARRAVIQMAQQQADELARLNDPFATIEREMLAAGLPADVVHIAVQRARETQLRSDEAAPDSAGQREPA